MKVVRICHREKQDLSISLSHQLTHSIHDMRLSAFWREEEEEKEEEAGILTTTE